MSAIARSDISPAVTAFLGKPHGLFIGGDWVKPHSGRAFTTFDPATGAHLAKIGEADETDVDLAVASARTAFEGPWSRLTARSRANLLFRLAELIAEHQDKLEELEVLDNGMPRERVLALIDAGVADGAELVAGGRAVEGSGHFVAPAVFVGTHRGMSIMRDEIFGPVGCFERFADGDLEGVAAAANDTDYGLAASVWTTSLSKAHRVARMIRAGRMSINCHGASGVNIPFGGFKQSGWGREFAKDGLDLYLETKSVTARF
jgi:acyl-CoA reductase-like NAD-dependent aldehyde dehydrogenase